jgi:hypothetical protein
MPARDVGAGLVFLACAIAGLVAAARFRRFLDGGRIRAALLATAAASAIILITHSLIP